MSKMKLKLDVEGLAVESFGTRAATGERGTVKGHEWTEEVTCIGRTCWDSCACISYPDYCG